MLRVYREDRTTAAPTQTPLGSRCSASRLASSAHKQARFANHCSAQPSPDHSRTPPPPKASAHRERHQIAHHKQTIIFGAALLFNETIESFVSLFETFLTTMSGKHPRTIFTDQDVVMAGAIAYVFRNTSHRLYLWHIYLNAGKHLGNII